MCLLLCVRKYGHEKQCGVDVSKYIDGFVLPIPREHLDTYKRVVEQVTEIWKEHGALDYQEFVSDGSELNGTRPFTDAVQASENEVVIFGWVTFASRSSRDLVNDKVANDPRMTDIVAPLTSGSDPIFNPQRMVYGGFTPLIAAHTLPTD